MSLWKSWIVNVGPNKGRGSTHAHGPVTSKGPVKTVSAKEVATILREVAGTLERAEKFEMAMMKAALEMHARDLDA